MTERPSATRHAREVLRDCERLLAAIRPDMPGDLWPPRWAGLVTLLRTIGQVLDKVDGKASAEAERVIKETFDQTKRTKPKPRIFWEFIKTERDNVVKQYELGVRMNTILRPGTGRLNLSTGKEKWTRGRKARFQAYMHSGAFRGRDALRLCRDAIAFWRRYLDRIDARVQKLQKGHGT